MMLAETERMAGNVNAGLEVIEEAFETTRSVGDEMFQPELIRVKGEILLADSMERAAEAEETFRESIEESRRLGTRWWELRAALELARLMKEQGREEEARQELSAIYGFFTEGFDTQPMREAKQLLDELG